MCRAVTMSGFGSTDVLQVGQIEKPAIADNEVLIMVAATSINAPDIVQRKGKYPPPKGDSPILGLEVSGVIDKYVLGSYVCFVPFAAFSLSCETRTVG